MVDGLFARLSMGPTAANGASPRHRKLRHAVSIAQQLDVVRTRRTSAALCGALGDMAMRLIDPEDRDEFEGFDGPTMIRASWNNSLFWIFYVWLSVVGCSGLPEPDHRRTGDARPRLADVQHDWRGRVSATRPFFGSSPSWVIHCFLCRWESYEVVESLVFTIVIICHGSIEETIALQCLELGAVRLLWELYVTLPPSLEQALQSVVLSALRNLGSVPPLAGVFPHEIVLECWRLVADSSDEQLSDLGTELLTNMASHDMTLVSPTHERLALLLDRFFTLEGDEDNTYRCVALVDLLSNLCVDPALCLFVMYELDDRKPRRYRRHSGAVYFLDLTECQRDPALRQSMEALAHNLSWSDPTGKRVIQKLGLSSYMARFALEPAINN
jgi:hypothetical protein